MSVVQRAGQSRVRSINQLVQQMLRGTLRKDGSPKTPAHYFIGVEYEKFLVDATTGLPVRFAQLKELLVSMGRYGWKPITEDLGGGLSQIIAAERNGALITLEPGGQVELSGAPLRTLAAVRAEYAQYLGEMGSVLRESGLMMLGGGYHPYATGDMIDYVGRTRYLAMRPIIERDRRAFLAAINTSSTQVSLDFSSEADMVDKIRLAMTVMPISNALMANSALVEGGLARDGQGRLLQSHRAMIWDGYERNLGGFEQVHDPRFSFRAFTQMMLDKPMIYLVRGDSFRQVGSGVTFRQFMRGTDLPEAPGERADMSDWANHLTSVIADVRIKNIIEMRGADGASYPEIDLALAAWWVGLLYDDEARAAAHTRLAHWGRAERDWVRSQTPITGLGTMVAGESVATIGRDLVAIAAAGLQRRAGLYPQLGHADDAAMLGPFSLMLQTGQVQADWARRALAGSPAHAVLARRLAMRMPALRGSTLLGPASRRGIVGGPSAG